jgi:ankyrin repeat protein
MQLKDLGNYAAARDYVRKGLANDPADRFFTIWDARLAAILGEPGAGARLQQAGAFDFRGNPVDFGDLSKDPWFAALEVGNLQQVRQLIQTEDVNRRSSYTQTPLMIAAGNGWESIASELIKAGAKLDEVDKNGDTALNFSAEFENPRITRLLLDAGANPDIQDKWKQTPLIKCTTKQNWGSALLLLEKKANVHLSSPSGTALHYAAGHGDIVSVNFLLKAGADVNATDHSGETPLIVASQDFPHSFILTPLLNAGAHVNAQDKEGRTALSHAVNPLLNIPLVELLMENGADPTLQDKGGVTPITKARLLGFDEIATKMEDKVHRREAFQFPQFAPADASLPRDVQNASCFVMPILLAQGDPLGRPSGVPYGDKKAARTELDRMFGIHSARDMHEVIGVLNTFEPRYREDAADISLPLALTQIQKLLKSAVQSIHASCDKDGSDETAWIKSHIIYLADLGVCAGYIAPEEGDKLIANASSDLSRIFTSWPQYLKSFVLGAQFHNGWEALRYRNICKHILDSGANWP